MTMLEQTVKSGKPFLPVSDANQMKIGAAAGSGVGQSETWSLIHKTILRFKDTPVPLTDQAGVVAYGGLKIYDFPEGVIGIIGAVPNLVLTKSSAGVNADWDGDFSLGTVTASNNATLTGTEANVLPSTATPQAVAGVSSAKASNAVAVPTVLTDASGGTANNAVESMVDIATAGGATPTAAQVDTAVNGVLAKIRNNFADLAAKVNELIALTSGGARLVADGHTTPVDLYVNFLVDDADQDVTTTPCNLILNGTVEILWRQLGDY